MLGLTDFHVIFKRRADDDCCIKATCCSYIKTPAYFDRSFRNSVLSGLLEEFATLELIDWGDDVVLVGGSVVNKVNLSRPQAIGTRLPANTPASSVAQSLSRASTRYREGSICAKGALL